MRILFVSPTGSFFSGAEVAIVNLMTYLSQKGHDIYNVIPDNETNTDEKYLAAMEKANIRCYALHSMKWWWLESSPVKDFEVTGLMASQHRNIAEVRNIIKEQNIDLVISNSANVFQGALAAACEQIPHYYIIHEFPFGEFGYYREKIELMSQLSEKIFAVDGQLYEELKKHFPEEKLIPFIPYSQLDNHSLKPASRTRIVSIGGITERKNQLELIKAYHALNRTDLELLFIGSWDEDYKRQCDAYITENQLMNISFLGYQNRPWSFVTDKDIIVFASKMEAFPLVFVESILSGVPAIISDNPGHLSVKKVFDTGHVYELGNIAELTKQISEILQDFSRNKTSAEAVKIKARNAYTLESTSEPFLNHLTPSHLSHFSTTLSQLKNFFNLDIDREILDDLKWNCVTVFFENDLGHFSMQNAVIRSLKKSDCFEIPITNEGQIRIDLSERPSAFKNIQLISTKYHTVLEPQFANAVKDGENTLFFEKDPQLIYDTRHFQNDKLIFSYEKSESDFLSRRLKEIVNQREQDIINLNLTNAQKDSDYAKLSDAYQELFREHQMVIGSRRWIMTTKFINFFRRKK